MTFVISQRLFEQEGTECQARLWGTKSLRRPFSHPAATETTKHRALMENQSQGRGKQTSETCESNMNPHHPLHAFDFLCVDLYEKLKEKCCKNSSEYHSRLKCWEQGLAWDYFLRTKAYTCNLIVKSWNFCGSNKHFLSISRVHWIFPLLSSPTQLLDICSIFITLRPKRSHEWIFKIVSTLSSITIWSALFAYFILA